MKQLTLLALLMLTACTGGNMRVPPFARVPYEAFSRESVVAIALREWRLFGQPIETDGPERADKPERNAGLWQRVGEYWWIGMNPDSPESGWTGKHDGHGKVFSPDIDGDFAWSAAFISYVMRIAGAGPRFPYSADHAVYMNAAKRVTLGQTADWLVRAERVGAYAPRLGDLICTGRARAAGLRYDDLPTASLFPAHCDIVVAIEPGRIGAIGGNVGDAVTLKYVPVTADGRLATPEGVVLDPRYPWMAVLRLLVDPAVG